MSYSTRFRSTGFSWSGAFPPGVKWLLIVNTAVFLVYFLLTASGMGMLLAPLALRPYDVLHGQVWQLFTYQFLHDPTGFAHILFNMLTLWMFGQTLERDWGTKRFLQYYFLCAIGAGVCVVVANLLFGNLLTSTIGASGAIYGLLMAFGMLYPRQQILFFFLFPIEARWFVLILGAIAFLSSFGAAGGGVSHVAHLGGMIFGYFFLKSGFMRRRPSPIGAYGAPPRRYRPGMGESIREQYKQWKLRRARRKFEVYLRKREKDSDKYVH
jgi:membrane associated rhomboid family serine protease